MSQHRVVAARPSALRPWARSLTPVMLLIGLLGFTGWNLTRSNGLDDARKAYARGELASSLDRALDHLSRRPWSREAALLAARCLSRLDFAAAAEPYYQEARPLSMDDLQLRAFGLVRGNHRQQAIQAYENILARAPENVTALRRLAAVQLTENNVPQLEALADRLLRIPGGGAIGYTLQGVVAHNDRNYEQAIAAFEHVLEIDPDLRVMPLPRALFWSHLASDLLKMGRVDDVKRHLTRALETIPDAGLMDTLGRAHQLDGSFDEAERCYRQVAEGDPTSFLPWLNLGKLELQRRRLEAARSHLETALKLKPRQADVLYALVTVRRLLGEATGAAQAETVLKDVRSRPAAAARSSKDPWPPYAL